MKLDLNTVISEIKPASAEWRAKGAERLSQLTTPAGALGDLLLLAERLVAMRETLKPSVAKKIVVTMAGDHGIVDEGVSAYPKAVTPQMVDNIVQGGAGINALAAAAGASVIVVDLGVDADLSQMKGINPLLDYKVAYGTKNMAKEPAMTQEQAVQALESGIEIASNLIENEGAELLATGDMGIGNTTPSTAILSVMTGKSVAEITGRGTGLDDKGLKHKIKVIEDVLAFQKPDPNNALEVLMKVGGLEIAGIAGLILGAAYHKIPVVVDGFISTAGALIAKGLAPASVDYMIASHKSVEVGHAFMWEALGLKPLLSLNLRVGEGTGAAIAMNIVESAAQILAKVRTFDEAGVSNKE
ncbi:MAG: nicotinate-nucleotide--dimethylbenzimidazole phosphoribosyltransferase [Clostridia bacterium]|nr:nicotinate-nucleotide--dimethylbenzimidazole phosphoribosyltransferase [Clostridia bacterium]